MFKAYVRTPLHGENEDQQILRLEKELVEAQEAHSVAVVKRIVFWLETQRILGHEDFPETDCSLIVQEQCRIEKVNRHHFDAVVELILDAYYKRG